MLPSLGLFSSLECPFYNGGAGQCSRPYCHYKHAKKDPNAPADLSNEVPGQPILKNDEVQTDDVKAGTSSEHGHKSRSSLYKAIVDAAPTYSPTPIAQLKSSHIPIPYTPTIPTRSAAVKKSKPSSEYVPHYIGTSRPTYPPYSPSSISRLNSQSDTPDDPLKNPLYELYGPEGAQYSPNDVDPVGTGYSYAPGSTSYTPYSPEYVPSKVNYNPQFSPPDSQLSDDDDNVDLAAETAAQTNGDPGGGENLIDLSELDNLELELEDDFDNGKGTATTENNLNSSGSKEISVESNVMDVDGLREETDNHIKGSSSQKAEKRRSSSTGSTSDSKKLKSSHEKIDKTKMEPSKDKASQSSSDKNGHKEKKSSSSSSLSSKKSSSSSSSSINKKSASHSSSKSSSSSSKSSKASSSSDSKKSHLSESKSKSGSSSSSSSKHKEKHRDKEKSKDKERERTHSKTGGKDAEKEKGRNRDNSKDHRNSKKSSYSSSGDKDKGDVQREKIEEEIRKLEVELDASLEDEDMIEQQCYEMFNEYSESMHNQPVPEKTDDQRVTVNEEPVASASSKKRIAHQASHSSLQPAPKPVPTLAKKCSPYQVMRDRWELAKKEKLLALEAKRASLAIAPALVPKAAMPTPYSLTNAPQASLPGSGVASGKKRIAGVPNVAMLLKPPATSSAPTGSSSSGTPPNRFYNKTNQRVDEFGRLVKVRVAHAPNMDSPAMRKPVVNPSDCRKFKVATRQANVNKLFQAYIDAGFGDASHDMALESEKNSTNGTESLGVYSHRIIQILKDLRACAVSSQNGPKMDGMSGIPNRVVSHNAMLAGKLGAKVSWSIQTAKKEEHTKPNISLYQQLQSYILTKEQLEANGFPMPCAEKGGASIKPSAYRTINQPSDPRQKICVRCLKPYAVNKRGEQVKDEECFYHWGRKYRRPREVETKYSCCDSAGSGCSVSPYHVFEQNWEKSTGYMSTLSKPWMESDPGVYALDCEMCYTTGGLELTRVTVIKEDLSVAYETLVKPAHKILDYNTRYSGITEDDLKDITTTIIQVQATLLGMFCDKTILIGHSLESDMKALKLIHPTIVDTSVVFPHKMGPPQKRALRNLAADHLKKIIQNDVGGHDSKEDAVAALELMLWRLKEDEKTR
ncbi:RNA exonuclease 1-like protein [Frankliniella fusca]|uniref:RNA exonuclease 1-like protein n=1 Tax=Frankliniella fusca TaxID=407009 RepID=A0AAE1HYS6_9NEOP|nr:RNA exonuclease 1-like protein [Frankliniella fusca]